MSTPRAPMPLAAALIGLASAAPAAAQDIAQVANTATLSFDASSGRQTIPSNTVSLDIYRNKLPTNLLFHSLPMGYRLSGMRCETSPTIRFTPAPIDAATLAAAPLLDSLDIDQPLVLELDNPGGNRDPTVRETSTITVTTQSFSGQMRLMETGPDTGLFAGGVPADGSNPDLAACGPTLVRGDQIRLSFAEDDYSLASEASIRINLARSTSLVLSKVSSVREASPGDFVQYRISLTNRGATAAANMHLTDTLPMGMRFEIGSTRGADAPVVTRNGRNLDFALGSVAAGASLDVTYVVTIAPGAPTGDAVNRVVASSGTGATSNEAAAAVRIRPLLFTDGFTLIGRVSAGGCGDPGRGRTGVPGIRLMLEDGTFVVTDKDGYYHVEGVRPGIHIIQLDTASIPVAYEPVMCDGDTRSAASAISRFVEADGGLLKRVDFQLRPTGKAAAVPTALPVDIASDKAAAGDRDWFAGQAPGVDMLFPTPDYNPRAPVTRVVVKHAVGQRVALRVNGALVDPINYDGTDQNDDRTIALSRWTGLTLKEGDNFIEATVLAADGSVVTTIKRIVHSSSIPARATFVPEKSRLVADGLGRPLIAVRVTDSDGHPVRAGTLVPFRVDQPYGAAIDAALEQGNQLAGRDRAQTTARVVGDDGLAFIALQPTTQAGNVHIIVSLADDKQVRASEVRAWLSAAARDWIVVGFGSGTVGYDTLKARTSSLPRGANGGMFAGRLAMYAKGRIKGSWLLTIAYDSDRKLDRSRGLLGQIDPDRYYTVYGDGSRQGHDAPTEGKLYFRLERRDFYALFGDFETALTDTQLGRYSRTLNGVKVEYSGNVFSVTAFAARNSQLHSRDEIQGNGLSGPYRLTGRNIVPNSDQLRIEVRDRLRPDRIISSTLLTRHIDYDIDPVAGTIRFREPVLGRDAELNPQFIVVEYETEGSSRTLTAGARATAKLLGGKIVLGAAVLRDDGVGAHATLAAVDVRVKPTANTEIRAEAASGGKFGVGTGRAWLAEIEHHDGNIDLLLYARSQDGAFGLGQQNLVEGGTRKFGVDTRIKLGKDFSLTATGWNATQLIGPGSRTAADLRFEYRTNATTAFVGGQFADDIGVDGQKRQSRLLTIGGSQALFKGALTLSGQVQVAPGGEKASVDFPVRQQIMADWRVTKGVRLLAGYEIADGKEFDARTARMGFDVAPWKGAKLMSTLNQQAIGENGQRTYAQYGMSQSLALGRHWTIDATLDASKTLRGSIPTGAFINAFATSANGSIYQNDGDYVAVTGGAAYRASLWAANTRVEYRASEKNDRWSFNADLLRTLGRGRTIAGSFRYFDVTDRTGARAASIAADLAFALRPPDSRWAVLERLQFRKDSADAGVIDSNVLGVGAYGYGFQATLRVVNNLSLNYRSGDEGNGHGFEASVYYGAKWVRGSFGPDDYTGFIHVVGFDLRRDVGRRYDIGVQGSVQHALTRGTVSFSGGPSIGVSPAPNIWISVGYNVSGYRDRDFEQDRYTRAGPYLTMRLKFDQLSLGKAGRTIFGIGR